MGVWEKSSLHPVCKDIQTYVYVCVPVCAKRRRIKGPKRSTQSARYASCATPAIESVSICVILINFGGVSAYIKYYVILAHKAHTPSLPRHVQQPSGCPELNSSGTCTTRFSSSVLARFRRATLGASQWITLQAVSDASARCTNRTAPASWICPPTTISDNIVWTTPSTWKVHQVIGGWQLCSLSLCRRFIRLRL
jgi:hypothetical protein